jgi:hypothetical protein
LKEPLRAALEKSAQSRGGSLNAEIARRLADSFFDEQRIEEEVAMTNEAFRLMRRLADVMEKAFDELTATTIKEMRDTIQAARSLGRSEECQ